MTYRTLSMSVSHGEAAGHAHNVEVEYRQRLDNVAQERTGLNQILVDIPLSELYGREFGEALASYNAQQVEKGHPERQITDYRAHVAAGKREREAYEMVVQIGSMETNPASDEACRLGSSTIYRDFLADFEREFPQFKVYQAAIHMDEATPHLHVAYVPVSHGNKRGLETRNSLAGALKGMGYKDVREANRDIWELLEAAAARHGVYRLDMGCDRAHLNVRDFKAMQAEIAGEVNYPYRNDPILMRLVEEQRKSVEELLEVADAQQVVIDSLVAEDPSVWNLQKLRAAVVEAREARDELAPKIEAARESQGRVRAFIRSVPQWWRDNIINPVSERLRAAVSRDRDDSEGISLADESRASRSASAALRGGGSRSGRDFER